MNELQIFENTKFGQIRTVEIDGKVKFVASDVAKALQYKDTINAIKQHCRWVVKHHIPHPQSKNKTLEVNVIPEGDIYRLVAHSELPAAQEFESWIFDEVLPSIRKTGTYSISKEKPSKIKEKEVEAKLNNSRVRMAQTWLKIAAMTNVPEYKQIANTYAANVLANKAVMQLPEAERRTYSATDLGEILGISSVKVGRIANQQKLKTEEFGKWFYDK